ncbi:MAG: radical SAM protein [Anaerolineae bacterium]|nr:radical SAM protein [Thermoflexales bacterium]MDW8408057.1 radical SAM protein [Anaerolineae bacterium]
MAIVRIDVLPVPITLSVRRESLTIFQDDRAGQGVMAFTFDAAGRLVSAFLDGKTYRRSLANDVLEKSAGPQAGLAWRARRLLERHEVQQLEQRAYAFARQVAAYLEADKALQPNDADRATALDFLSRIALYDFARLEAERETYRAIYGRVPIMPPDQYLALALQATEGCSFNACTFCGFYRDRSFRVKSPDEFRRHIIEVKTFLGFSLSLRRSIFLGDANALLIPQPALLDIFDALHRAFDIAPNGLSPAELRAWRAHCSLPMEGVYSFVDAFSTRRKTVDEFAQLAERGLRRVYVGLETGDAELLRFLGKPNTPADVLELVDRLKQAGVHVGVIILAGAGGQAFAEQHVAHTVEVINHMRLGARDLIYFSELIDYPGSEYAQKAAQAGIAPLSVEEIEQQMRVMRAAFRFAGSPPTISFYDVREFVY